MQKHPGIRIDAIPARYAAGLLFVAATLFIFLVGVPATRQFFLISLIGGLLVALARHLWFTQTRW